MDVNTSGIIGQSTTLAEVFKVLGKVAPTDSTVLVTGESGTGKELLVRALHANSQRAEVLPGFPWVTPVRNWPGRGLDRHRRSRWLS